MMFSGRWYYYLFSRFLLDAPSYYYDMNATLTWKLGSRHRVALRYFHSLDDVDFNSRTYFNYLGTTFDTDIFDDYDFKFRTTWRNQAASLLVKTVLSPALYWQTQLSYSAFTANNLSLIDYEYTTDEDRKIQLYMETDIRGRIRDLGLKSVLNLNLSSWNQLKMGCEWNSYHFENDVLLNGYSEGRVLHQPNLLAGFIEDKVTMGLLSARSGLRISRFSGRGIWNQEYRINAAYQLRHNLKLKASWGQYLQYIVSINTQEYELSQFLDTYYPLAQRPPSASTQSMVGIEADIISGMQLSLDLYYKDISRAYAYDYNASQVDAPTFFEKLRQGRGISCGAELLLKGQWGRTSGWASYGWSRSRRRFPYDPTSNQIGDWPQVVTPVKNNIRLPYYLRLDLGIKKRLRTGFGAMLANYLNADRAYLNVSIGNVLFALQRDVWFYIRDGEELYGVGTNYIPEFSTVENGYGCFGGVNIHGEMIHL